MLVLFSSLLLISKYTTFVNADQYYGTFVDPLIKTDHNVKGTVYIADENTLFIKDFSYDGKGPSVFFYVGIDGMEPSAAGLKIFNENGEMTVLQKYANSDLVLKLPTTLKVSDLTWFAIWCDEFKKSFGHVVFHKDTTKIPQPHTLGPLPGAHHDVSASEVIMTTDKTLLLKKFNYDGLGPDAYFFAGRGDSITHVGATKIPNEAGSVAPLPAYHAQDVELTLPSNYTWSDFDWFAVYCVQFSQNFASTFLPHNPLLPPFNVLREKHEAVRSSATPTSWIVMSGRNNILFTCTIGLITASLTSFIMGRLT